MKQVFKKKDRSINWNKSLWKSSGYPETTQDALREFDRSANYFFNVPETFKKERVLRTQRIIKARKFLLTLPEHEQCWISGFLFHCELNNRSKKRIFGGKFSKSDNKYNFLISFLKFLTIIWGSRNYSHASAWFESWMLIDLAKTENSKLAVHILRIDPCLIEKFSRKAWQNKEIVKEISKRKPQLILWAPKSFRQNYQLVLEAVTANPKAFEFLNTYISKDAEFMIEAVRKNQKCSKYISRISKKTLSKLNILDRAWLKKMEIKNA
tara:strand:- start:546 stop:1346 length:801 start_codon:yes stop_codon:yes gene_type:complete